MDFGEAYRQLEQDFRQRVFEDTRLFSGDMIYLPNVEPEGPTGGLRAGGYGAVVAWLGEDLTEAGAARSVKGSEISEVHLRMMYCTTASSSLPWFRMTMNNARISWGRAKSNLKTGDDC